MNFGRFMGSSPHTRGAPAAGCLRRRRGRDHPRIRGEHELKAHYHANEIGIIPAYAGSTLNDLLYYTAFLNTKFSFQSTLARQRTSKATARARTARARYTPIFYIFLLLDTYWHCSILLVVYQVLWHYPFPKASSLTRLPHSQLVASQAEKS